MMEAMESKRFDLEQEMFDCVWFRNKVRESKSYAQNLYAAMCNNEFVKNDVWPILQDKRWSASWRGAGGIVADLREEGDYLDWYCSGIQNDPPTEEELKEYTAEQVERLKVTNNYVAEGHVTNEIRADLLKLGWIVIQDDTLTK